MDHTDAHLVPLSSRYRDSFISAVREFQADTETGHNEYYPELSASELEADFESFVEKEKWKEHADQPDGRVPQTTLWLVDGDEVIGTVRIRHFLNERLEKVGGHIGYDVRPSKRRLGYGTKILELAIPKARELGVERILVTCNVDNIGSRKIIEKNGGILQDQIPNPEGGPDKLRFWVG